MHYNRGDACDKPRKNLKMWNNRHCPNWNKGLNANTNGMSGRFPGLPCTSPYVTLTTTINCGTA